MQFIDLKTQYARIKEPLQKRFDDILTNTRFIMGSEILEVEEALAKLSGARHCITCANGTIAIEMCLRALNIGPGDAVITPTFSFIAAAEAIRLVGAEPVFCDIKEDSFNIDIESLADAITKNSHKNIKAIIPVGLFGQPADMNEVNQLAIKHGLTVIEDAAQCFGSNYQTKKSGNLSTLATTSFFPAKPLGCYGDGGAVFCNDDQLATILKSIRVHGQGENQYDNVRIGVNGRFDTLQAAVILEKLKIFADELELRNQAAAYYSEKLAGKYTVPTIQSDRSSVWAQYCLLSEDRAGSMAKLKTTGLPSAIYYPKALHLQEAYADLGYPKNSFPIAESICEKIFAIPMHPYLTKEDQDKICTVLLS